MGETYNANDTEYDGVSPITTKRVKVTSRSDDERARSAATRTAAITPSAAPGDAA